MSSVLTYHGTALGVAMRLVSNPHEVDVTRGGGELGRGFYAGDSIALAAAWAQGRFSDCAVLQIVLADAEYVRLSILTLKQHEVAAKWQKLKSSRQTRMFTFGFDVVYAPFATYPAWQHKFETLTAEGVLKRARWSVV